MLTRRSSHNPTSHANQRQTVSRLFSSDCVRIWASPELKKNADIPSQWQHGRSSGPSSVPSWSAEFSKNHFESNIALNTVNRLKKTTHHPHTHTLWKQQKAEHNVKEKQEDHADNGWRWPTEDHCPSYALALWQVNTLQIWETTVTNPLNKA